MPYNVSLAFEKKVNSNDFQSFIGEVVPPIENRKVSRRVESPNGQIYLQITSERISHLSSKLNGFIKREKETFTEEELKMYVSQFLSPRGLVEVNFVDPPQPAGYIAPSDVAKTLNIHS